MTQDGERLAGEEYQANGADGHSVAEGRVQQGVWLLHRGDEHAPVPADYVRKQAGEERGRYITDELKPYESEALVGRVPGA